MRRLAAALAGARPIQIHNRLKPCRNCPFFGLQVAYYQLLSGLAGEVCVRAALPLEQLFCHFRVSSDVGGLPRRTARKPFGAQSVSEVLLRGRKEGRLCDI
jgi:hypothetical protein